MKFSKLFLLPFALSFLLPFSTGCLSEEGSEGLVFIENVGGSSYALQSVGTCKDEQIVIPSQYEGKPVTRILSRAFYGCAFLKGIDFPDEIVSIDDNAFKDCVNLSEVAFPNSLESIGGSAFANCESLSSVRFGAGSQLEKIGSAAFDGCVSLTKFEVPSKVTDVSSYAFQNCTALEEMVFLEGATYSTETYAHWNGCVNLKRAYLPGSFRQLSWAIFQGCTSLETVFVGTEEEFAQLDRYYNSNSNGPFWEATHYFYSEEQPIQDGNYWHYVNGKMTFWE